MGPIAGTDVIARPNVEPSRGRQDSVNYSNLSSLLPPAENEWLIVGVSQPTAAADPALYIRSERVVGDRYGSRNGEQCTSQHPDPLFAHPNKTIHVHHHGVLSGGQD